MTRNICNNDKIVVYNDKIAFMYEDKITVSTALWTVTMQRRDENGQTIFVSQLKVSFKYGEASIMT